MITIGGSEFPLPTVKKKYDILIVGNVHIPVELTQFSGSMLFGKILLTRLDQPCQWIPFDEHEMDEVRKHNFLYPPFSFYYLDLIKQKQYFLSVF